MKVRKLVSFFLAVFMLATLLPVSALAIGPGEEEGGVLGPVPRGTPIANTQITLDPPQPGEALPNSATATDDVTVSKVRWKVGDTEATGAAKYATVYTVELTLAPAQADATFDENFAATLSGFDEVKTTKGNNTSATVTATYETSKAPAPVVTAENITVPNTGRSSTYTFTVSGLLDPADYSDSGLTYTVAETEDSDEILTLVSPLSAPLENSNTISYEVEANEENAPQKSATFTISFSAVNAYCSLPEPVLVTVTLEAGDPNTAITIDSVTPADDPIEVAPGYGPFDLTVTASAADSAALQYAWTSNPAIAAASSTNGFSVPAGLAPGLYEIRCQVTSATNPTGVAYTFRIQVASPNVVLVPQVKDPVYNGTAQAPEVPASEKYTVTVTPQTDVKTNGGYELTLSLKDKTADVWGLADGSTTTDDQVLRWNIAPKPLKVYGVKATDKVYDASTSIRITAGELAFQEDGNVAYAAVQGDQIALNSRYRSAHTTNANAGAGKAVVVSGFTLEGADAANYTLLQPDDVVVTVYRATPGITLSNYTAAYTGLPIQMVRPVVTGVPGGTMPSGFISYTYYTDMACSKLTSRADGAMYAGSAPSAPGTYYVVAHILADGNYTSAYAYAALMKIVTDFNVNFDIAATSNRGGSISPSGTVKVASGSSKTFTFRPKDGYELVDVLVDGESIGVVESYTFRDVKADHTIKAIFTSEEEEEPVPPVWQNPFDDVSRGDWFYASVEYAVSNGLMEGVSKTDFGPNAPTTRAEVVLTLWRLAGKPDPETTARFDDLTKDWYRDAIAWAAEEGVAEGVGQGRFAPEETITREQLVTMLYRYARYQAYDVSASANLNRFADSDAVSGFAANAMRWAVSENIILGKEGGRLDPQGAATRAEIAAVFERFVKTVVI